MQGRGRAHLLSQTGRCALTACLLCVAARGQAHEAADAVPADGAAAGALAGGGAAAQTGGSVTMSVPLVWDSRVFGEVIIQVARDGSAAIESRSLSTQLGALLNATGNQRLAEAIGGDPFVTPSELAAMGITASFDMARLELNIATIDARLRPVESIGTNAEARDRVQPNLLPASFSAYMNVGLDLRYNQGSGVDAPDLLLYGAARYRKVVLEFDGGFADDFSGGGYRFYRRGVRAVYDEPAHYRRWSVGDLRLENRTFLNAPFIAGIGVQKSRRVFDPFSPVSALNGRQIFISSPSTVEIQVNGAPYRVLRLQPGTYNLDDLPIRTGSNNVQIIVRDAAGRENVTRFGYFFQPIDLAAGEEEYTAAFGLVARDFTLQPDYSNDPIFYGNYRRAFSDIFVAGGGVQLTRDIQVFSAETQIVPQVIPGGFGVQAAISTGRGFGFAARADYQISWGGAANARRFAVSVDYQNANFATPADLGRFRIDRLTVNASYAQNFSLRTSMVAGATYFRNGNARDQSNFFVDVTRQLRDNIRASAGVEYGRDAIYGSGFGIRFSISVLLGGRNRADASYRSRQDFARASISRGVESEVGSFGYSLDLQNTGDSSSVEGLADFIGNRFDARVTVGTQGDGFGDVGDRKTASLQLGTSIAFADGTFGIGRPISDAFLLARPHETIRENGVIVGRGLQRGNYEASSGLFGAAVQSRLSSYNMQDVQYDLKTSRPGYDIGTGVVRVDPPYRGGYELIVGNARFVSAVGFLQIDGAPAALASGTIMSESDEGFTPQPFFTNSAGRFGIIGLAPGKTYTIRLGTGQTFEIHVPADSTGLYRIETLNVQSGDE